MRNWIKNVYHNSKMATKIRLSYIMLLVPTVVFLVFCFYNLWSGNRSYEDMINSTVMASEFSLDFKKDFDYETYLLLVGNKSWEESRLENMLSDANRIVSGLEELTESGENRKRLTSVKKYLNNLEIYTRRIEENLSEGKRYEDNLEIWENDVQIVTTLVESTMFEYLYYEIQGIQESREAYQQFFFRLISYSIVAFLLLLIVIILLSVIIPLSITKPVRELTEVTNQVAKGDLSVRAEIDSGAEAQILADSMNAMIDKINELLEQVTQEQIRLRKAEFELLQSQINPHFLYNALDAIMWLAESGEQKKVVSMVGSLSEFFRTSLNQGKDIVTIKEELQHARSYLEIQQVRYQDILNYEIDVPKELEQNQIPKITIQPLLENALYHGIKNKRGLGKIEVKGVAKEDHFEILISDNGIGINAERLEQVRNGIYHKVPSENDIYGLYNVNERIKLNFGEEYGIEIESIDGDGTEVTVKLPYIKGFEMIS